MKQYNQNPLFFLLYVQKEFTERVLPWSELAVVQLQGYAMARQDTWLCTDRTKYMLWKDRTKYMLCNNGKECLKFIICLWAMFCVEVVVVSLKLQGYTFTVTWPIGNRTQVFTWAVEKRRHFFVVDEVYYHRGQKKKISGVLQSCQYKSILVSGEAGLYIMVIKA